MKLNKFLLFLMKNYITCTFKMYQDYIYLFKYKMFYFTCNDK